MAQLATIQGELRLPAVLFQGRDMDTLEQQLRAWGLLPVAAQARRWRMDPEAPGGYVLAFTVALPGEERHGD